MMKQQLENELEYGFIMNGPKNAETTLNIFIEQSIRLFKPNGKSLYGY